MASLTGSFPRLRRLRSGRRILALGLILAAGAASAAMPDYLREALGKMSTDVPPGWAYTRTTVRDDVSTTERYDPTRPPGEQWTLLRFNGQPPSSKDVEKYLRYRAANPAVVSQATFQKGDVDPGSVELVREDTERAEFTGGFRTQSAGADKMLGHLRLRLTVNKRFAHLEKFTLELRDPYSPILSVKMNELVVALSFAAPGPDRPGLPVLSTSHFLGRIFFFRTEENLHVAYSDYARVN